MKIRCDWVAKDNQLYQTYHDSEWGVPVTDDKTQFEFLILEGAQAGLSWETILKRRGGYRKAFAQFNPKKVSTFTESTVKKLLNNPGIIRNKLKVRAAITNAQLFLDVQTEFGSFNKYIWQFVGSKPVINKVKKISGYPVLTKQSQNLSKDLKKRGFKFVGPTIMYAHMQATGMVNDHMLHCFRYKQINKIIRRMTWPV